MCLPARRAFTLAGSIACEGLAASVARTFWLRPRLTRLSHSSCVPDASIRGGGFSFQNFYVQTHESRSPSRLKGQTTARVFDDRLASVFGKTGNGIRVPPTSHRNYKPHTATLAKAFDWNQVLRGLHPTRNNRGSTIYPHYIILCCVCQEKFANSARDIRNLDFCICRSTTNCGHMCPWANTTLLKSA